MMYVQPYVKKLWWWRVLAAEESVHDDVGGDAGGDAAVVDLRAKVGQHCFGVRRPLRVLQPGQRVGAHGERGRMGVGAHGEGALARTVTGALARTVTGALARTVRGRARGLARGTGLTRT